MARASAQPKTLLWPHAPNSCCVRYAGHRLCCLNGNAQELLTFLQKHRPWLQNLLSDSLGKGLEGSAVQTKEAALLSSVTAALLKCCDPEVGKHELLLVRVRMETDYAI